MRTWLLGCGPGSRGAGTCGSADEPHDPVPAVAADLDGVASPGGGSFAHPVTHHGLGKQLVVGHGILRDVFCVHATMSHEAVDDLS